MQNRESITGIVNLVDSSQPTTSAPITPASASTKPSSSSQQVAPGVDDSVPITEVESEELTGRKNKRYRPNPHLAILAQSIVKNEVHMGQMASTTVVIADTLKKLLEKNETA